MKKHQCHCGFNKHREHLHAKRVGVGGVVLMVLHLLYHVAECLILPAVFAAFSRPVDGRDTEVTDIVKVEIVESSDVSNYDIFTVLSNTGFALQDNLQVFCPAIAFSHTQETPITFLQTQETISEHISQHLLPYVLACTPDSSIREVDPQY